MDKPSSPQRPFPAFPRLFYGWWIVLVSMITDGVKQGSFNRGFTVYVIPIQNSLGLSAAAIGWADTLGRLMGGIQGPVMGYLTDRLGPGFMLAFGGITSGLGSSSCPIPATTSTSCWSSWASCRWASGPATTTPPSPPSTTGSAGGAAWPCPWCPWATASAAPLPPWPAGWSSPSAGR